jgi:hypothetical protein
MAYVIACLNSSKCNTSRFNKESIFAHSLQRTPSFCARQFCSMTVYSVTFYSVSCYILFCLYPFVPNTSVDCSPTRIKSPQIGAKSRTNRDACLLHRNKERCPNWQFQAHQGTPHLTFYSVNCLFCFTLTCNSVFAQTKVVE